MRSVSSGAGTRSPTGQTHPLAGAADSGSGVVSTVDSSVSYLSIFGDNKLSDTFRPGFGPVPTTRELPHSYPPRSGGLPAVNRDSTSSESTACDFVSPPIRTTGSAGGIPGIFSNNASSRSWNPSATKLNGDDACNARDGRVDTVGDGSSPTSRPSGSAKSTFTASPRLFRDGSAVDYLERGGGKCCANGQGTTHHNATPMILSMHHQSMRAFPDCLDEGTDSEWTGVNQPPTDSNFKAKPSSTTASHPPTQQQPATPVHYTSNHSLPTGIYEAPATEDSSPSRRRVNSVPHSVVLDAPMRLPPPTTTAIASTAANESVGGPSVTRRLSSVPTTPTTVLPNLSAPETLNGVSLVEKLREILDHLDFLRKAAEFPTTRHHSPMDPSASSAPGLEWTEQFAKAARAFIYRADFVAESLVMILDQAASTSSSCGSGVPLDTARNSQVIPGSNASPSAQNPPPTSPTLRDPKYTGSSSAKTTGKLSCTAGAMDDVSHSVTKTQPSVPPPSVDGAATVAAAKGRASFSVAMCKKPPPGKGCVAAKKAPPPASGVQQTDIDPHLVPEVSPDKRLKAKPILWSGLPPAKIQGSIWEDLLKRDRELISVKKWREQFAIPAISAITPPSASSGNSENRDDQSSSVVCSLAPPTGDSTSVSQPATYSTAGSATEGQPTPQFKFEVDFTRLNQLFFQAELDKKSQIKEPSVAEAAARAARNRSQSVLNAQRAQNIEITLKGLGIKDDFSPVVAAVQNLEYSTEKQPGNKHLFKAENLKQLQSIHPKGDELRALKDLQPKDQDRKLTLPERFLLCLMGIPRFTQKVDAILGQLAFESKATSLQEKVHKLDLVCDNAIQSLQSGMLRAVFALILKMGNYINYRGARKGVVAGLQLSSLEAIKSVKSIDGSKSFLRILADHIEEQYAAGWSQLEWIAHCGEAAEVNVDDVEKNLAELKSVLEKVRIEVEHPDAKNDLKLQRVFGGFLNDGQARHSQLTEAFRQACAKLLKLVELLGDKAKSLKEAMEMLPRLESFGKNLLKARQEIDAERIVEERRRHRRSIGSRGMATPKRQHSLDGDGYGSHRGGTPEGLVQLLQAADRRSTHSEMGGAPTPAINHASPVTHTRQAEPVLSESEEPQTVTKLRSALHPVVNRPTIESVELYNPPAKSPAPKATSAKPRHHSAQAVGRYSSSDSTYHKGCVCVPAQHQRPLVADGLAFPPGRSSQPLCHHPLVPSTSNSAQHFYAQRNVGLSARPFEYENHPGGPVVTECTPRGSALRPSPISTRGTARHGGRAGGSSTRHTGAISVDFTAGSVSEFSQLVHDTPVGIRSARYLAPLHRRDTVTSSIHQLASNANALNNSPGGGPILSHRCAIDGDASMLRNGFTANEYQLLEEICTSKGASAGGSPLTNMYHGQPMVMIGYPSEPQPPPTEPTVTSAPIIPLEEHYRVPNTVTRCYRHPWSPPR